MIEERHESEYAEQHAVGWIFEGEQPPVLTKHPVYAGTRPGRSHWLTLILPLKAIIIAHGAEKKTKGRNNKSKNPRQNKLRGK